MDILFYSFLILNGIAFSLMGYDKYLAKAKKIRIPEQILLVFFWRNCWFWFGDASL
jgi:uncharacterized membrane protein YsdA (DUF1294 family)